MLRSLIGFLSPAFLARIEAESRNWIMQCKKCGHQISVWDYGGMRYKAHGTVYRLGRCRGCGKASMLRVYKKENPARGPNPEDAIKK